MAVTFDSMANGPAAPLPAVETVPTQDSRQSKWVNIPNNARIHRCLSCKKPYPKTIFQTGETNNGSGKALWTIANQCLMCTFPARGRDIRNRHADAVELDFLQLFPDGEHCVQQLIPAGTPASAIPRSQPRVTTQGTASNEKDQVGPKEDAPHALASPQGANPQPSRDAAATPAHHVADVSPNQNRVPPIAQPVSEAGQNHIADQTCRQEIQRNIERVQEQQRLLQRSIEARMLSERAQQESQYRAAWTRNAIDQWAADDIVNREIQQRQRQHAQPIVQERLEKEQAEIERQLVQERIAKEQAEKEQQHSLPRRPAPQRGEVGLANAQAVQEYHLRTPQQEQRAAEEKAERDRQNLIFVQQQEQRAAQEKADRERQIHLRQQEQRAAEEKAKRDRQTILEQQEQRAAQENAEQQCLHQLRLHEQQAAQEKLARAEEIRQQEHLRLANLAAEETRKEQLRRPQAAHERTDEQTRRFSNVGTVPNPVALNDHVVPRPFVQAVQPQAQQLYGGPNSSTDSALPPSGLYNSAASNVMSNAGSTSGGQPGPRSISPAVITEIRNAIFQIQVQIGSTQTKLQNLQFSPPDGNGVILKHVQQNVLVEQLRTLMNIHSKLQGELQQLVQQQQQQAQGAELRAAQQNVLSGYTTALQDPSHSDPSHGHQSVAPSRSEAVQQDTQRQWGQRSGVHNQPAPSNRPLSQVPTHAQTQSQAAGPPYLPFPVQPQPHIPSSISPVSHAHSHPSQQNFNHVPHPMRNQMQAQSQSPTQAQQMDPLFAQISSRPRDRRESQPQVRAHVRSPWQHSTSDQGSVQGKAPAHSPAQSASSSAHTQLRNSTDLDGQTPQAQHEQEQRDEHRQKQEEAVERQRERNRQEQERQEQANRDREREEREKEERGREEKRQLELHQQQELIFQQQQLIHQQQQLIQQQQQQNLIAHQATSSELVSQGQLYIQNLSESMQMHERLFRAHHFQRMGMSHVAGDPGSEVDSFQSPLQFGAPTPAFVESGPLLMDPEPFDILDIGPLPGENVQQDSAERFTEIHDMPPESFQSRRDGNKQGSIGHPSAVDPRSTALPAVTLTPMVKAAETARQSSSIRNTPLTALSTEMASPIFPNLAEQQASASIVQRPPPQVSQRAQGSVTSPSVRSVPMNHMMLDPRISESAQDSYRRASETTDQRQPLQAFLTARDSVVDPSVPPVVPNHTDAGTNTVGKQDEKALGLVPTENNHQRPHTAPTPTTPFKYQPPVIHPPQSSIPPSPAIQPSADHTRVWEEEDRKPIIIPSPSASPLTRIVVINNPTQAPATAVPVLKTAQAAAPPEQPASTSQVRERGESDTEQSGEQRPMKRRRTEQSRIIPPRLKTPLTSSPSRASFPALHHDDAGGGSGKISPLHVATCHENGRMARLSAVSSSDCDTSPRSGLSSHMVEISVSRGVGVASSVSSSTATTMVAAGDQGSKSGIMASSSTAGGNALSAASPADNATQAPNTTHLGASQAGPVASQASSTTTAAAAASTSAKRTTSVRQTLEKVFAKNSNPSDAALRKLADALKISDIEPVKQLFALWRRNGHKPAPDAAMGAEGSAEGGAGAGGA